MHYIFDQIPPDAIAHSVDMSCVDIDGQKALQLELDAKTRRGTVGIDFVDKPTFVLLPGEIRSGAVETHIQGQLLDDAPDYARGFIGIAYRVKPDLSQFEAVYLRPTNGRLHNPPAPRHLRAVQYFAYPDWPYEVLREREPEAFEAGADISLGTWHRLRVEFDEKIFVAFVDGTKVLEGENKIPPAAGQVGLWVDIGTKGFFREVRITSR